ncbi:hypothetical protein CDD83_9986 [Cordyceps sp. RAO-2017]|nr:hypothetical protein CDD83_9986 [Cordyceps sp. RAO-2017]
MPARRRQRPSLKRQAEKGQMAPVLGPHGAPAWLGKSTERMTASSQSTRSDSPLSRSVLASHASVGRNLKSPASCQQICDLCSGKLRCARSLGPSLPPTEGVAGRQQDQCRRAKALIQQKRRPGSRHGEPLGPLRPHSSATAAYTAVRLYVSRTESLIKSTGASSLATSWDGSKGPGDPAASPAPRTLLSGPVRRLSLSDPSQMRPDHLDEAKEAGGEGWNGLERGGGAARWREQTIHAARGI